MATFVPSMLRWSVEEMKAGALDPTCATGPFEQDRDASVFLPFGHDSRWVTGDYVAIALNGVYGRKAPPGEPLSGGVVAMWDVLLHPF
jgi:hypothetical protein